jgi:hypothetical protein
VGRLSARLILVALVACALVAFPARARADYVAATQGSLTMTSDPGDYIGGGQSYSFATPDYTFLTHGDATYFDGNMLVVQVSGAGEWWYLGFQAPTGQTLTPGVTYANAIRGLQSSPPPGSQPRMDIFGDGRGCNTLTGSFTVLDVTYGPYGYLQSFHVTFEQHCEGATPALRGELNVVAPPAPTAQSVHLTIDPSGVAARPSGAAVVSGTISCALPYTAYLNVYVTQQTKKGLITGSAYSVEVPCSGPSPTAWSATVPPDGKTLFTAGPAQVQASTSAFDDYYTQYLGQNPIFASDSQTATAQLRLPH